MACIYILQSEIQGKRYVGSSHEDDPAKRLIAHNMGRTRSTKSGRPWKIIYTERLSTYAEARKRELFLKTGAGRKFVLELIHR